MTVLGDPAKLRATAPSDVMRWTDAGYAPPLAWIFGDDGGWYDKTCFDTVIKGGSRKTVGGCA